MIKFWRVRDEWGEFSNFYIRPIFIDGKMWKSTEHYFQAQKFLSPDLQEHIGNQPKPKDAAHEGRRRDLPLRADWEEVKDDVMRRALRAKFDQHPDLKFILLSTLKEKIVEDSPTDPYWGWGADQKGKNMLGILLMELRDWYFDQQTIAPDVMRNITEHLRKMPNDEARLSNVATLGLVEYIEVLQAEIAWFRRTMWNETYP